MGPLKLTGRGTAAAFEPAYLPAYLAGLAGASTTAKRSAALSVERLLSTAFRFFPMLTCLRTRRFQVFRVFDAIARAFYHSRVAETTPGIVPSPRSTVRS
jgi:hypothetical protein